MRPVDALYDESRNGLPCRFPDGCVELFHGDIKAAAGLRDAHEQALHGYHHQPMQTWKPAFSWAKTHRKVFE